MDRREAFRSMFALSGAWVSARGLAAHPIPAVPAEPEEGDDEAYWSRLRWQFLIPATRPTSTPGPSGPHLGPSWKR